MQRRISFGAMVLSFLLQIPAALTGPAVCPSPLLSCGTVCYACESYGCSRGLLIPGNSCGANPGFGACPPYLLPCGKACYSCDSYKCIDGLLLPGNSCDQGAASAGITTSQIIPSLSTRTKTTTSTQTPNPTITTPITHAGSTTSTTTANAVHSGSNRTLTIINNCSVDLLVNLVSGSTPFRDRMTARCSSDADCATGGACLVSSGLCFFVAPPPFSRSTTSIKSPADQPAVIISGLGGSQRVEFQHYPAQGDVVFSGNIYGVQVNLGAGAPLTRAEFTFLRHGVDFYDVTVLDGFNIPIEMKPSRGSGVSRQDGNPYWCGEPGSPAPTTGAGPCSWIPVPPGIYHVAVSMDANESSGLMSGRCLKDGDCPRGQRCGVAVSAPGGPPPVLTCGQHVGYFNGIKSCEASGTCEQTLNPPNLPTQTLRDLFLCTGGTKSCYQDASNTDEACCGCADWWDVENGTAVSVPPVGTRPCTFQNPNWTKSVRPFIQWMKAMCPSAYTYPYDDMSSTFTCTNAGGGNTAENSVDYDVTFCPGNTRVVAANLR